MIWNYIRDFLVQYIFGGYNSNGQEFTSTLGKGFIVLGGAVDDEVSSGTSTLLYNIGGKEYYASDFNADIYLSVGDWLSTTFTIIIMCLIVVFAIWLVRWVFKAVSSAFLLK